MTSKVIALVDGSAYARSVCDHAVWIAGRTGNAVELMHVLGRREGGGGGDLSGSIALGARSALLEELSQLDEQRARLSVQRGRAILEDAKAILDAEGVQATTHLRHGDLIEAIAEKEGEAELLLVGKRGEAADFAKGHLGSNLERVMRASHKPLMVASRAFQPVEKVLVAYDGSASAMRAVDHVSRNPLYSGMPVRVVTVGSPSAETEKGLADARAMLAAAGLDAETKVVSGLPEEVLASMVADESFHHLVMGTSGHSRLRALFVGSTTLEMIRACRVPIMLIR